MSGPNVVIVEPPDALVAVLARIVRAIAEREAAERRATMVAVEGGKRGGEAA